MSDQQDYSRVNGRNVLRIVKHLRDDTA
jgi:hypothetical protein